MALAIPGIDSFWNVNVGENVTLAGSGSATYYVVVWLEETGSDQTTDDAGMAFAAGITFTSNTGAGVTGIITSAG